MKHLVAVALLLSLLACGRNNAEDPSPTLEDMSVDDASQQDESKDLTSDASADSHDDMTQVDPARSAGCDNETAWTPGQTQALSMMHDGIERTFSVRLPERYNASRPAPVVLALHGGFGSANITENETTQFNPIAQREGFIMVYPEGVAANPNAPGDVGKIRTWNAGGCCGNALAKNVDDVGFLLSILDTVEQGACVDRQRLYATGMSNGAMMSYRLACEASTRVAAVAPVAGLLTLDNCTPTRPIPLLHIHGIKDPNVPLDGSEGCGPGEVESSQSIAQVTAQWNTLHACEGEDVQTLDREDATCTRKGSECAVEVCLLPEGNHSWPGGVPREPRLPGCSGGEQVLSFDASEYIWSFFLSQKLGKEFL